MGEKVASALAQEGMSRISSYISTIFEDRASKAHNMARLEMALSRLDHFLERTGTMPITFVSLLCRWKMFKRAYIEGTDLLSKHKQKLLEGHEGTGQVVVRSSSYLERIAHAVTFSVSSLVGLNKDHLSSSVVQIFEWYADCAEKFVTDVESGCPLRRDTFRYPFVRQLFEGETLWYQRVKGRQQLRVLIWPVILEGRGVEAYLQYKYFDPERLDKSFLLDLMLRLSESTDIVGTAINCLQSSASLFSLVAQDAVGELALLHSLQDMTSSHALPWAGIQDWYTEITQICRSDPVCCQANGHGPRVNFISSELSHIFLEQTIAFGFNCYIQALEISLPSASDEAGRNVMTNWPPLELTIGVAPHWFHRGQEGSYILKEMGSEEEERPYGSIQQTIDTVRSEAIGCLIHQPEVTNNCTVFWLTEHGSAWFAVKKPSTDVATGPKTRGRYKTRSAAKRKR